MALADNAVGCVAKGPKGDIVIAALRGFAEVDGGYDVHFLVE
jgi:hypothetical protein